MVEEKNSDDRQRGGSGFIIGCQSVFHRWKEKIKCERG
jgi:hypothetical protein